MAKPSGVKITFAIDQLAEWFCKEGRRWATVGYVTDGINRSWVVDFVDDKQMKLFDSFSAMRRWMEAEIRRRRILYRRFSL